MSQLKSSAKSKKQTSQYNKLRNEYNSMKEKLQKVSKASEIRERRIKLLDSDGRGAGNSAYWLVAVGRRLVFHLSQ